MDNEGICKKCMQVHDEIEVIHQTDSLESISKEIDDLLVVNSALQSKNLIIESCLDGETKRAELFRECASENSNRLRISMNLNDQYRLRIKLLSIGFILSSAILLVITYL